MLEEKTISATEFKAKCLELMDDIAANRIASIVVTKRGKPVAKMVAPPVAKLRPIHEIVGKPIQLDPNYNPFAQVIDMPEDWKVFPDEDADAAA